MFGMYIIFGGNDCRNVFLNIFSYCNVFINFYGIILDRKIVKYMKYYFSILYICLFFL